MPAAASPWPLATGAVLIAVGLVLNGAVFFHLGTKGVFYGNRFGHELPWVRRFPFSWFPHPQYLGAAMLVWGFFVVMRFPAPDWYASPVLESVYYVLGSRYEQ